jgi:pSer/pThr/pTyr-binding forkhead associated (FHA) protein
MEMLEITLELKDTILDTFKMDKDEITIGRNSANDITIDNLAVSDRHARIVRDKTGYYVEDLGSTNGTFVDGRKITRLGLVGRQEITIGKHTLDVCLPGKKDAGSDFARTMKINR